MSKYSFTKSTVNKQHASKSSEGQTLHLFCQNVEYCFILDQHHMDPEGPYFKIQARIKSVMIVDSRRRAEPGLGGLLSEQNIQSHSL